MSNLPPELVLEFLRRADGPTAAKAATACRLFSQLIKNDDSLWKSLFERDCLHSAKKRVGWSEWRRLASEIALTERPWRGKYLEWFVKSIICAHECQCDLVRPCRVELVFWSDSSIAVMLQHESSDQELYRFASRCSERAFYDPPRRTRNFLRIARSLMDRLEGDEQHAKQRFVTLGASVHAALWAALVHLLVRRPEDPDEPDFEFSAASRECELRDKYSRFEFKRASTGVLVSAASLAWAVFFAAKSPIEYIIGAFVPIFAGWSVIAPDQIGEFLTAVLAMFLAGRGLCWTTVPHGRTFGLTLLALTVPTVGPPAILWSLPFGIGWVIRYAFLDLVQPSTTFSVSRILLDSVTGSLQAPLIFLAALLSFPIAARIARSLLLGSPLTRRAAPGVAVAICRWRRLNTRHAITLAEWLRAPPFWRETMDIIGKAWRNTAVIHVDSGGVGDAAMFGMSSLAAFVGCGLCAVGSVFLARYTKSA